jgi:ubiquinone/menaquinone biosynthesis C-methylase UbiE
LELELASAAVGARNIPKAGSDGEHMFRSAFIQALKEAGSLHTPSPQKSDGSFSHIIDIGCGTGTSTRLLGQMFSQWKSVRITGVDLSPHFILTGVRLQELSFSSLINKGADTPGPWVCSIPPDRRIEYLQGDGTDLRRHFDDCTVDIINIQFVFHELPIHVACNMIKEAHRMLKADGGQLWICEMDFESPAYKAQRNNPILFSLVRATEPFLDEYATGQSLIWKCLYQMFDTVTITAATGRHYAVVASKDPSEGSKTRWNDKRFAENGTYRIDDTHLQVWENKAKEVIHHQPH